MRYSKRRKLTTMENEQLDNFNQERSAEELLALVRLVLRLGFVAVIIIGLIVTLSYRRYFFKALDFSTPPIAEHLPLPAEKITVADKSAVHENVTPTTPKTATVKVIEKPNTAVAETPKTAGNATPKNEPEVVKIDLANSPITAPIPNAYLVVYLSHRALGLVVDGQYIRTYHHLGLPAATGENRAENDGRLPPIGDWRVVGRSQYNDIELLMFDAPNFYLRGDNQQNNLTQGDIAITAEQMQELSTAIIDGTIIMIRP